MVLSCYFYVSLNLTDILQFPDLAEFRDTAPLSGSCYVVTVKDTFYQNKILKKKTEDISIVKKKIDLHKVGTFSGLNPWQHSKIAHLYIT